MNHFIVDKRTNQLVKWWCTNTAFWFAAFVPSTCFHTRNLRFLNQPLWKSLWINQVLKGWVFKYSGTQICSRRYEQMQWNTRLVGKCFVFAFSRHVSLVIFSMGNHQPQPPILSPLRYQITSMNKHDMSWKPQPNLGILEVGKKIAISCACDMFRWFSMDRWPVDSERFRGLPTLMDLEGKLFQWHHFFGCQYFVKNTCSMQKGFFLCILNQPYTLDSTLCPYSCSASDMVPCRWDTKNQTSMGFIWIPIIWSCNHP